MRGILKFFTDVVLTYFGYFERDLGPAFEAVLITRYPTFFPSWLIFALLYSVIVLLNSIAVIYQ
jgi:hypothetical protein